MKNISKMNKVVAAAIVLVALGTSVNAQSVDNAKTTAILVQPLTIAKVIDMHFGTVAASATAGTIVLGYADDVSATGGAAVIDDALAKSGDFKVDGAPNETFSITLSAVSFVLTSTTVPGDVLTVDGITVDEGAASTLDNTGTRTLKVAATLQVIADAAAGTYENADELEITVAYN